MIICMNYNTDGERYIAKISFIYGRSNDVTALIANQLIHEFDEVYIIPFLPTKELINEVVLNGCRM